MGKNEREGLFGCVHIANSSLIWAAREQKSIVQTHASTAERESNHLQTCEDQEIW